MGNRIVLLLFAYLLGTGAGWVAGAAAGGVFSLLPAGIAEAHPAAAAWLFAGTAALVTGCRAFGVGVVFAMGCSLDWKRAGAVAFAGTLVLDALDAGALHGGLAAVSWLAPRDPVSWLVIAATAAGTFGGACLVWRLAEEQWLQSARTLIFSMLGQQ